MPGTEGFLGWLGGATLAGGGLILVVLLLRRTMQRQVPPSVLVLFWVLVVLRLLVPMVPVVRVSVLPSWTAPVTLPGATVAPSVGGPPPEALPVPHETASPSLEVPPSFGGVDLMGYGIFALWLLGFLGVVGCFLRGHLALRRRLKDLAPLDVPRIRALADECRLKMGVRVPIEVFTTSGLGTPAVYGLLAPRILIPQRMVDQLSDADWRNVLCHELAHVHRADLFLQGVAALALAVHWFNPLVWVAWVALRTDTELACDRAVLDRMAQVDRPQYGHTLLNLAAHRTTGLAWTPALVPWGSPRRDWKRRILMIATHRTAPWWKKGLFGILVLFLGVVGLTQAQPISTPGSTSGVTLTVAPGGKPRQSLSLSPTGFLKSKIYELVVGGAQDLSLNGTPLTSTSVLVDRNSAVLLDGTEVPPPWVLHGWGDGKAIAGAQELIRASNDDVAEWAGLVSSLTLESASPLPEGPHPPLGLGVYQPAELSFGFSDHQPRPQTVSGSPWVAVKDSTTIAQAVVSTVAEAQALVPWTLTVPATLPPGYQQTSDIWMFQDKWGHFFSSISFRPSPAIGGAQLLLMQSDRSGWRPKKDGPGQQMVAVGKVQGRWRWTWSQMGSIDQKPVAVRATELSWTRDNRSFILVDSTGLTKQALAEIASTIP